MHMMIDTQCLGYEAEEGVIRFYEFECELQIFGEIGEMCEIKET